jgi:hypothetical protein
MKPWLILASCGAFVLASISTTGIARALIDLIAFVAIIGLVWSLQDSTKIDDIE